MKQVWIDLCGLHDADDPLHGRTMNQMAPYNQEFQRQLKVLARSMIQVSIHKFFICLDSQHRRLNQLSQTFLLWFQIFHILRDIRISFLSFWNFQKQAGHSYLTQTFQLAFLEASRILWYSDYRMCTRPLGIHIKILYDVPLKFKLLMVTQIAFMHRQVKYLLILNFTFNSSF